MPWHIAKSSECSASKPWAVIKDQDSSIEGCHPTQAMAQKHMAALYANEPGGSNSMSSSHASDCGCEAHESGARAVDDSSWDGPGAMSSCVNSSTPGTCFGSICAGRKSGPADQASSWALPHHKTPGGPPNAAGVRNALARLAQTQGLTNQTEARNHLEAHMASIQNQTQSNSRPPRDNLVRGIFPFELREASSGEMPTLVGHFAVFDQWTEIDSAFEGRFMERIAPGAFKKTFQENLQNMRVLFQHGADPQIGNKPLGPINVLREEDEGAYYEVSLLDSPFIQDILPGLRAGLYGASFRFRVQKEEINKDAERSDWNPEGIPERTIQEASVMEFGPVTFPAYAGATAGVRSLTDDFILQQLVGDPERLEKVLLRRLPTATTALHEHEHGAAEALHEHGAEESHSDGSRETSTKWEKYCHDSLIVKFPDGTERSALRR